MSDKPMFSVGDIVRVKSLEQLTSEFTPSIDVPSGFTPEMWEFCGRSCTIKELHTRTDGLFSYLFDEDQWRWMFDECVLEWDIDAQIDPTTFETSFEDAMGLT